MLRGPDERMRLISVLFVALLFPILVQLLRFQILEHSHYRAEAQQLVERPYALPEPPWGCIRDRKGRLLVGNIPVYDVGAEVGLVPDPVRAAEQLAPFLDRPRASLQEKLTLDVEAEGYPIVWRPLARRVSYDIAQDIGRLNLPWVTLTPSWVRYYAEGGLASHVLGFVNQDGLGYGVQAYQLRFLRGERVSGVGQVTLAGPGAEDVAGNESLPYSGTDLRLTLDRTVQAFVEGELEKAILEYNAEGGTILVMDPRTGALLAVASRPAYEPYRYADYAAQGEEELFQDPAISQAYEPGSVFKVVTAAAAVDSGRLGANWSYEDTGALEYGGVTVRNSDRTAHGQQNLEGILARSLNVGAATLSTRVLGPEHFYEYVRAFGFGQRTGVELSNEVAGQVHMPSDWDWTDSYLATNSFGQGISVTPLQMATAVGAIANDGALMQPYVVAQREYPDGRTVTVPPRVMGHPISPESARHVSELMARAVERKIPEAQVAGYRIAGKTGTAQIPGVGGYDPDDVIVSFVGFAPADDPQVLILVKLDRPDVPPELRWGTRIAAPVFRGVASRLFVLLGIPPSETVAERQGP
jgi:cell division protein FtsI/penicillin-binding protein 2